MVRTACIEHTGERNWQGYGRQWRNNKRYQAHRLAYCDAKGVTIESITGKVVRHICDNPPCINPDHLVLGTQRDNVHDRISRGRCNTSKGHALPHTTPADKEMEVRALLAQGITHREITKRTGVSTTSVSRIRNGEVR